MSEDTKMIKVVAHTSTALECHVMCPVSWDEQKVSEYANDHLDTGDFVEEILSSDWHIHQVWRLNDSETNAVMEAVANGSGGQIVNADPTVFDEDPMEVEFEDDDKFCIKFRITVGDQHFFEYSWVTHKFNRVATNEDLIKEVYGLEELDPIGTEGEQPYWLNNMEHGVEVYHREPMNDGEYNALKLMGVLY